MMRIIYYTTSSGENPVDEFLDSLDERQQSKVLRLLTTIKLYGLITVIPHIKKLIGTPFWEIRILGRDNIRVFYITVASMDILLLHGFIKKTQKTPGKEIGIAQKRLEDYLLRKKSA
jgi:phage-related protein